MTNPIIISILLGMLASLCQIRFSFVIDKTLDSMSALATPLALLGLGAGFEGRKALKQIKPTLVCSAIKLLIQPMLFLPLAAWMGFRDEKMVAILIMLGAPTTFFSSITITFWLFVLRSLSLI